MSIPEIAIVNQSSLVDIATCDAWVNAVRLQVSHDLCVAWWRRPPPIHARTPTTVPAGAWPVILLDDADQAGALGYHDLDPHGRPYARVFVRTAADNGVAASSVLSHEVLEAVIDPWANGWADTNSNVSYALEVCDPCESTTYIGSGEVAVSDFALPAWFDPATSEPTKTSFCGATPGPFRVASGGYAIRMTDGRVSQVFGAEHPGWRRDTKQHPASRTARRMSRNQHRH